MQSRSAQVVDKMCDDVLARMGQMNLAPERAPLGDRQNIVNTPAAAHPRKLVAGKGKSSPDADSSDRTIAPPEPSKAQRLKVLRKEMANAVDSQTFSRLVREFGEVMHMNSGRTLTKEGMAFLETLKKKLEDPSVIIVAPDAGYVLICSFRTFASRSRSALPYFHALLTWPSYLCSARL